MVQGTENSIVFLEWSCFDRSKKTSNFRLPVNVLKEEELNSDTHFGFSNMEAIRAALEGSPHTRTRGATSSLHIPKNRTRSLPGIRILLLLIDTVSLSVGFFPSTSIDFICDEMLLKIHH